MKHRSFRFGLRLVLPALATALMAGLHAAAPAAPESSSPLEKERTFRNAYLERQKLAEDLLSVGDLDALERMDRTPAPADTPAGRYLDAASQRWAVASAFDRWRPQNSSNDLAFESQAALLLDWAKRRPDLALPHIAYARLLREQAWAVRGTQYWSEISPDHQKRFIELSDRALRYLRDHRALVESEAFGRATMLWVMRDNGAELDPLWEQALIYIRRAPEQATLYSFLANSFVERWGGSSDAVEYVARESIKATRERLGMAAYSLIYNSAESIEYGAGIFKNSHAKWPLMKQGFEDHLERVPDLHMRVRMAYFACLAQDRETLRKQLDLLGEDAARDTAAWGSNGARTLVACKRFANAS